MIGQAQFVNGIWMGIVLIALGLLPALRQSLMDSLSKLNDAFSPVKIPSRLRNQIRQAPLRQQPWLAVLGAAIIAASFALYLVS
jgi:sulfite exporter TauE/SafE